MTHNSISLLKVARSLKGGAVFSRDAFTVVLRLARFSPRELSFFLVRCGSFVIEELRCILYVAAFPLWFVISWLCLTCLYYVHSWLFLNIFYYLQSWIRTVHPTLTMLHFVSTHQEADITRDEFCCRCFISKLLIVCSSGFQYEVCFRHKK